jgi:hypothetical protein
LLPQQCLLLDGLGILSFVINFSLCLLIGSVGGLVVLQFLDPSKMNQYFVLSLTMGFDCLPFTACNLLVVFVFSL